MEVFNVNYNNYRHHVWCCMKVALRIHGLYKHRHHDANYQVIFTYACYTIAITTPTLGQRASGVNTP